MAGAWLLAVGLLVGAGGATAFADTASGGANESDGHSSTTSDPGDADAAPTAATEDPAHVEAPAVEEHTDAQSHDTAGASENNEDAHAGTGPVDEPATTDPAEGATTDPAEEATTDPADGRPLSDDPAEPAEPESDSAYDTLAPDSDEVVTVPENPTAPATVEELATTTPLPETPASDTPSDDAPPAAPPTAPPVDLGTVIEDVAVTIVDVLEPVVTAPTALAAPMPEFAPGPPNENRRAVAGAGAPLSPLGMLRMLTHASVPATVPHAAEIPTLLDGAQRSHPDGATSVAAYADPAETLSTPVGAHPAAPDPPLFEELREILQSRGTILIAAVSLSAMFLAALPGLAGIAIPGAAGVGIGYRQAKAMRSLRGSGIAHLAPTGPLGVVRSASVIELRPSRRRAQPPPPDRRPVEVSSLSA